MVANCLSSPRTHRAGLGVVVILAEAVAVEVAAEVEVDDLAVQTRGADYSKLSSQQDISRSSSAQTLCSMA